MRVRLEVEVVRDWVAKKNGVQRLHAEVFVLWIGLVDWELLGERREYPRGRRWRAFCCGDNKFDNNKREQVGGVGGI